MILNLRTNRTVYAPGEIDVKAVIDGAGVVSYRPGNPGRRNRKKYVNLVCAFDIETTRLDEYDLSIMYIWQLQLGPDITIIGRTWEEFEDMVIRLRDAIPDNTLLPIYVHNLSFEFQFLQGVFTFNSDDVFCIERRKILKAVLYNAIEFRCSYLHCNMGLDMYVKKMRCDNLKLSGEFDYSKRRFPWTDLTDDELAYCIMDVVSLVEAITKEMVLDGDNLATIPATSTGYVRRRVKTALLADTYYQYNLRKILPDYKCYVALREAFRGGDTHANRAYVGCILEGVKSCDRSSSYPDVMLNRQFPMSELVNYGSMDKTRVDRLIYERKKAALLRIALFDVVISNPFEGCPYLSKDKATLCVKETCDNGRILRAKYYECTVTDIDYKIIMESYSYSRIDIIDTFFARYDYLPEAYRETVREMYREKTELKGVKGQEVYYDKIKNMVNSLYGMSAQQPLKPTVKYSKEGYYIHPDDYAERLKKHNNKAFLSYAWGVWVTAWARYELRRMINAAGDGVHSTSAFIYCDTDSVKYIGDIDDKLEEYNESQISISCANGGVSTDPGGKKHYLGVYESEGVYDRFVTWGAKRYAVEVNGDISVTCAGVVKRAYKSANLGGEELKRLGGLEAFKPGVVFIAAGGKEARYRDNIDITINIDSRDLRVRDCVSIVDSEYTLSLSPEYDWLLTHGELALQMVREWIRENDINQQMITDL